MHTYFRPWTRIYISPHAFQTRRGFCHRPARWAISRGCISWGVHSYRRLRNITSFNMHDSHTGQHIHLRQHIVLVFSSRGLSIYTTARPPYSPIEYGFETTPPILHHPHNYIGIYIRQCFSNSTRRYANHRARACVLRQGHARIYFKSHAT